MSVDRILGFGAASAVIAYRSFLSPIKGFQCPHQRIYGAGSCSDFGLKAFRTYGFREGLRLLRERFVECKAAARSLMMSAAQTTADDTAQSKRREKKEKWYDRWCSNFDCGMPSCGGRRGKGDLDGAGCDVGDCDVAPDCSL